MLLLKIRLYLRYYIHRSHVVALRKSTSAIWINETKKIQVILYLSFRKVLRSTIKFDSYLFLYMRTSLIFTLLA